MRSTGMLAAISVAWFQKGRLPDPATVRVLCASIGNIFGGDASYITCPLNGTPMPREGERRGGPGYLSEVDPKDPLAYPINSPALVTRFPPTLLVTSTSCHGVRNRDEFAQRAGEKWC